jgi:hypothetical protein
VRIHESYAPGELSIDLAGDIIWLNIHEATALIAASLPIYRPLVHSSVNFISSSIRNMSGGDSYGTKGSTKNSATYSQKGYISAPSVTSQKDLVRSGRNSNDMYRDITLDEIQMKRHNAV